MSKFCGCYLVSLISYQRIRDVLRLNIRVYGIIRYVKSLLILFVYLRVRTYTTLLLHEREKNGKGGREGKQERKELKKRQVTACEADSTARCCGT